MAELEKVLERARSLLSEEDYAKLKSAVDTLQFLTVEIEKKGMSIRRLQKMLFGPTTEKTRKIIEQIENEMAAGGTEDGGDAPVRQTPEKKRKGHGRNGAAAYSGAEIIEVAHELLKHKDGCPDHGCDGKLYVQKDEPAQLLRIVGAPPIQGKVYKLERLRCNLCGKVFTARPPDGIGDKKYDESVAGMVGCLRYGLGVPLNRTEKIQGNYGIPLPATTQWELVRDAAPVMAPVFEELIDQAAQGEVVHNDDTGMKVLELVKANREARDGPGDTGAERTGMFTSSVVSKCGDHTISLFFTGRNHAGENLATVLKHRAAELDAPIHMCDALDRNKPGDCKVIQANCTAHGRRRFADVAENFPDECRYVLDTLRKVYRYDAVSSEQGMSAEERLRFHQEHSRPLMEELREWMKEQVETKKTEPNSGLGEGILYMLKRWDKLTLFLRQPGAPVDNNDAERALKKAILHRKGSLFYKTLNGAHVGDIFMSLIHTAELAKADPFHYITEILRHPSEVRDEPSKWMPWNYKATLASLAQTNVGKATPT
jgi:transposase